MADQLLGNLFIKHFEALLKKGPPSEPLVHWSMHELTSGKEFDRQIHDSLAHCNYGLALVSDAFLNSDYIKEVELEHFLRNRNIIPVGLGAHPSCLNYAQS